MIIRIPGIKRKKPKREEKIKGRETNWIRVAKYRGCLDILNIPPLTNLDSGLFKNRNKVKRRRNIPKRKISKPKMLIEG
ncbi:MAG: hypothetical protein ABIK99_04325 [candidate division WOR-3 bacterium]